MRVRLISTVLTMAGERLSSGSASQTTAQSALAPMSCRILLVDDQPDNLRLLSKMLSDAGYEVRRALSGALALRNVDAHPPDLILLDINMPELTGYEVCETLKSEAKTRNIPIIFLSASNSEQDKVKALELGGVDYITKPFQVREVLARVATQLKLQQLNHLRANLSRMLVHDLRAPLSSISLSSSSLLRRSYIKTDDQDILQTIYATSQRLNQMLNDLLITAKLDVGQLTLNRTPADLREMVASAFQELRFEAELKQINLVSEFPDNVEAIIKQLPLDVNLFHRVIENLVTNAVKFSPVGGTVTVKVGEKKPGPQDNFALTATDSPSKPNRIFLQVTDEGIGVPEAQQKDIFKPYETGQTVDGVSQLGLGLSFCKLVVEAHGGAIDVIPNQPRGSTFTVSLPYGNSEGSLK